jgi:hypothetical protein
MRPFVQVCASDLRHRGNVRTNLWEHELKLRVFSMHLSVICVYEVTEMKQTTRRYQRLGNSADAASSAAQDAADSAQSYVTKNPWTALAIGTAAGVTIGALLTYGLGKRFS